MKDNKIQFKKLREIISSEKKTIKEIVSLSNYLKKAEADEKKLISAQIKLLKGSLRKTNEKIPKILDSLHLLKTLPQKEISEPKKVSLEEKKSVKKGFKLSGKIFPINRNYSIKDLKPTKLEKETLKRMREKKVKIVMQKEEKANPYVMIANRWFSGFANKILSEKGFENLERDLIKANLSFTPRGYISVTLLTSLLSIFLGVALTLFFLFFNIESNLPIISRTTEAFGTRILKVFWIIIVVPIGTFLSMYLYPSLEKGSAELKINEELPFATIHMSAISGSMIDPSKIFNIIISTKEYPYLEKEFKKLINEINIYGYDFVSALRDSASNSPSRKLSELFNGLATTINSGGDLPDFFDKRAETLLFEHRLDQEKKTKAAETFMDIYISVVIAAPMILMILLMMMKISGLGVSLSTSMISLIMVLAVTVVNVIFLTFLHLKK